MDDRVKKVTMFNLQMNSIKRIAGELVNEKNGEKIFDAIVTLDSLIKDLQNSYANEVFKCENSDDPF